MPDQLVPVRNRVSFAKLEEVLELPDLVAIQKKSFDQLLNEGIKEVLDEVSPIEDFTEQFQLYFGKKVGHHPNRHVCHASQSRGVTIHVKRKH